MVEQHNLSLPEDLSPDLLIRIVLIVLKTHYSRESDKLNDILLEFEHLNHQKLGEMWEGLAKGCPTQEQALEYLTEWITASLDGGNLRLSSQDS